MKALLAKRVGYRCSHPGCPAHTIGPADVADAVVTLGEAAHITAAAPGGPCYDRRLSSDERVSHTNGIWMCRGHARLIDRDRRRTARQLRVWKRAAEERARQHLILPGVPENRVLQLDLEDFGGSDSVNRAIGTILDRCGVESVWGRSERGCVQDVLIELARNALEHGGASRVGVAVEPFGFTLFDHGAVFDPLHALRVPTGVSGGRLALAHIRDVHANDLLLVYGRRGGMNELSITRVEGLSETALRLVPCAIKIDTRLVRAAPVRGLKLDLSRCRGCRDIVVVLSDYMSLSDVFLLAEILKRRVRRSRARLHVVLPRASDQTRDLLKKFLQAARFLRSG